MKRLSIFLLIIMASVLICPANGTARGSNKVVLATLEWLPYCGKDLPGGGASIVVAKRAFAAVGIELEVDFLPWKRALQSGRYADGYFGYMPEYSSPLREKTCYLSDRMGDSPLGIVERVDKPLKWNAIEELGKYRLGVVDGYVNTNEFDLLMEAGRLNVSRVTDDLTNMRKVLAGRIDGAVIDANVFAYNMSRDRFLRDNPNRIRINPQLLEVKGLFVCFRRSSDGKRFRDLFNKGLLTIDYKRIQQEYLQKAFEKGLEN